MIDIHCHILAGIDDGPKSWDVSEEMCQMAAADGIEHTVATPHANSRYAYDRATFRSDRDSLQERVGNSLRLGLGCDFHMSYENIEDALKRPDYYIIEGGHYQLVELSNYSIPVEIADGYTKLMNVGITPILTHPERNPILQKSPEKVLGWVELGCAVQITASAFTGAWGETAWKMAEWYLKRDAVHFLATDAHDTKRRPPVLSAGRDEVAEICGQDVAKALVEENPRAVINGKPLPYWPKVKTK